MSKLLNKVANTVIGLMFLSGGVAAAGTDISNSTAAQVNNYSESKNSSINYSPADPKELLCLARNIFYESASEPEEGKIAVGVVTLNRVDDPRFPKTVCEVVKQKTLVVRTVSVENKQVNVKRMICQFSWVCEITRRITQTDERWIQSLDIARRLLEGEHDDHKSYLGNILYFHSAQINPMWIGLKKSIRIGSHVFYVDRARHK